MRTPARLATALLAALALCGPALAWDPPPASPQGKPPAEKPPAKKPTAKTREINATLDKIAEQFKTENLSALMKHVPEDGSIYLALVKQKGTFSRAHAEKKLKAWLDKVVILKLKATGHKGLTGTYELIFRNTNTSATQSDKKLYLTIKKTKRAYMLTHLRVE